MQCWCCPHVFSPEDIVFSLEYGNLKKHDEFKTLTMECDKQYFCEECQHEIDKFIDNLRSDNSEIVRTADI